MTADKINDLLNEAKKQISVKTDAEQIVVVRTRKKKIYAFTNQVLSAGNRDEDCFIQTLKKEKDEEIEAVVCMWGTGELDIPSLNLRNGFIRVSASNEESVVVLQSENGLCLKTIKECMPA